MVTSRYQILSKCLEVVRWGGRSRLVCQILSFPVVCSMNTPQRKQGLGPHHSKTDNIHEFCSSPCTSKNSSYQPSLDWMEEELARVCGEGSEEKSSPIIMSPQENPNSSLPIELSEKLVEGNSLNNNNIKPEIEKIQENNTAPSIKPLANGFSWRLLRKKNEAELERKLKKIEMNGGTEKRARLERRFTELFGPDDVHPSALNGKRKDREEIAALTVKHLMPMYKKQKIASKDLFKKLAKQISNCIMEKVDCPGENDVQSKVQELFANGKTFTSEVKPVMEVYKDAWMKTNKNDLTSLNRMESSFD